MRVRPFDGRPVRLASPDGAGFEARLAEADTTRRREAAQEFERRLAPSDAGSRPFSDGATPTVGVVCDADRAQFDDVLVDIDSALSFGDPARRLEVFKNGRMEAPDVLFSTSAGRFRPARIGAGPLFGQLAEGMTVRLNSIDSQSAVIAEWCRLAEMAAVAPANANVYLTAGSTAGTLSHVDSHDVLMVQITGSKGWTIGTPARHVPVGEGPDVDIDQVALEHTLQTGESFFLPRGTAHRPSPDGSLSIHVSIGIRRPSRVDVAEWLVIGRRSLHDDVPAGVLVGGGPLGVVEPLAEFTNSDAQRALAAWRATQPPRRIAALGAVRSAADAGSGRVRWCAPGGVVLDESSSRNVVAGGLIIDLDSWDLESFERLVAGESVSIDEWAGSHRDSTTSPVQMLWHGLVEPVRDEEAGE